LLTNNTSPLRAWMHFMWCPADEETIAAVLAASAAVRSEVGDVARSNSLTGSSKEGSWRTVYLNHQLAERLPQLRERLEAAACQADKENWQVRGRVPLELCRSQPRSLTYVKLGSTPAGHNLTLTPSAPHLAGT
jgi:hypothetical protein